MSWPGRPKPETRARGAWVASMSATASAQACADGSSRSATRFAIRRGAKEAP